MNELPRKPVAQKAAGSTEKSYDLLDDLIDDYLEPLHILSRPSSAIGATIQPRIASESSDQDLHRPVLRAQKSTPILISRASGTSVTPFPSDTDAHVPPSSKWKTVVDETVYFAGGLISHPFESTRHYSILRHTSALVYYKGPSTSVTISVFGDSPLPADRSFWLQRKGFSGNAGMAASALMRTTSNWIDVTPSVESLASNASASDERAWQRAIKNFLMRALKEKRLSTHVLRETCVLRIPAAVTDGYLRVVMCTGQSSKKSLCPSPTFRLASTSSDVSVIRGASLTTLPLEMGLKAASAIGNAYAQRVVGPAQAVAKSKIKYMQPEFIKKHPDKLALARAGIKEQFGDLERNFDAARDVRYSPFHDMRSLDEPPGVIGNDSGPEKPFPLVFDGRVVPGTGQSEAAPTANLANVPEDILLRLSGVYIGWASTEKSTNTSSTSHNWFEAIIMIGPSFYAATTVIPRNIVTVHILYDFGEGTRFFNTKLKIIVMAPLRAIMKHPWLPTDLFATISRDREIAIASLSREMWQPDISLDSLTAEKRQRTVADRYVELRSQVQRHVDNIPIHRVGFRTDRAVAKDEAYSTGGFYIRR